MKTIIIYKSFPYGVLGGLYEGVKYEEFNDEHGPAEDKVLFYLPLKISGRNYQEKQENLRQLAIDYQATYYDFCNYSYGELLEISSFFETYGRKYGLINEFKAEGII